MVERRFPWWASSTEMELVSWSSYDSQQHGTGSRRRLHGSLLSTLVLSQHWPATTKISEARRSVHGWTTSLAENCATSNVLMSTYTHTHVYHTLCDQLQYQVANIIKQINFNTKLSTCIKWNQGTPYITNMNQHLASFCKFQWYIHYALVVFSVHLYPAPQ